MRRERETEIEKETVKRMGWWESEWLLLVDFG